MGSSPYWRDPMACDECDKCRAMGYKFCNKCGQNFSEESDEPEPESTVSPNESLLIKSVYPAMFIILVAIVIDLVLLVVNFGTTFDWVEDKTTKLYIFITDFIVFAKLTETGIQLLWVFITFMLLFCGGIVLYRSRSILIDFKDNYMEKVKETPVYWLGMTLGASIVIQLIIMLILNAMGVSTPTPSELKDLTIEKATFLFSEAAVIEELTMRVFWMGIPMALVALFCGRKDFLKNLWGGFGASKVSILFLFISTIIFAYAHVGGWGMWKMFPVFAGGLCMGYLYMRFGLHASIIFHMINDYLGVWLVAIPTFGSILEILIILTGIVCIPVLFKRGWEGLRAIKGLPVTGYETQDESSDSNTD